MVKYNLSIQHIQKPNTRKLLKICEIFSGGTPSTKNAKYWNGTIPWLSSGETRNNFITKTERKITLDGIKNSSTRLARKNDVVVASAGQGHTRGQVSLCLIDTYVNQSVIVLRANTKIIHPKFLFYNLKSRYTELRKLSDAHSSRGSLPKNILITLDMVLPPLIAQEKIGKILYDLDIKIENLQKQNKILEQIAQTVFKSWFVDFDGVAEFEDSELGNIPKGWKIDSLESITNNIKDSIHTNNIKSDLSYIGLEHMPRGSIALTNWEDARNLQSSKFRFSTNQLLFGKLRPYFKKVGIAPVDGICSTDILVLDGKDPIWNEFILFVISSNKFIQFASQSTTGTRMPRSNWNYMKTYSIVIPSFSKISAFHHIAKRNLEKINNNVFEIIALTKIRDALLPKLMSGEIRV